MYHQNLSRNTFIKLHDFFVDVREIHLQLASLSFWQMYEMYEM